MPKLVKTAPESILVLQTVTMSAATNPNSNIFGRQIKSQMDVGGAVFVKKIAKSQVATVNVSSISFLKPAFVGNIICCHAKCVKAGYTSITIAIGMWVKKVITLSESIKHIRLTETVFTCVAVDTSFSQRPLPEHFHHLTQDQLSHLDQL